MFATNARYKREAYRGSEFAARILAENGLQVVMKVIDCFIYLKAFAHQMTLLFLE